MKLNGAGGNQPTISQQLAFADSACANLFDNVYFKGAGQDISSAVNYVAQSAALKNRLQKSGAWLQSVGKSAYMLNAFQERVAAISSDDRLNASSQQEYAAVAGDDGLGTVTIVMPAGEVRGAGGTKLALLAVGDLLVVGGVQFRVTVISADEIGTNMRVVPILGTQAQTETSRAALAGFAAQNTVAYVAATGAITFADGTGAAPPDVRLKFPIGSFFVFKGVAADATNNVPMEVLSHTSNLIIVVRPIVGADVAPLNHNFARLSGSAGPVSITSAAGESMVSI